MGKGDVQMQINIRSSYDSFRELRENNAYYVDKTEMIEEYLVRRFDKAVMFTRPRRFGKTLTMTMFRDFLDIRQDSKEIFSGLKVMEFSDVVESFMNQKRCYSCRRHRYRNIHK